MTAKERRVLQIAPGVEPAGGAAPSHLAGALGARGIEVERYYVSGTRKPAIIANVLRAAPDFSRYAAVLPVEYTVAFACGLRSLLTRSKTPVIALGLNLSGSVIRTGLAPLDRLLDAPFRRLALSVVHSRCEMTQFEDLHHLNAERLAFAHWGFDLPNFDEGRFARRAPYVAMIGRNNRDIETFCRATQLAGIDGVIVAPSYARIDFTLPANVEIHRDLSFGECLACIQKAEANLILVRDDDRGAGHITAVAAMHLGVPQIYTRAAVLGDYLIDGVTGIAAPVGDADAVAAAIGRVRSEPGFARAMAEAAKTYAARWLSHEATARRQAALILAAIDGAPVERVDAAWLRAYEDLAAGATLRKNVPDSA